MTLPRTGLGTTSLGAVGGPRGVAAGGLRILVEFISQYDPAAVKQLEGDLTSLQALQDRFGERQIALADRLAKVEERQAKARATLLASIKNLDKTQSAAAKRQLGGIEAGLGGSPRQRAQAKKDLELFIVDLQKSGALTAAEARQLQKTVALETQRRSLVTQLNNANKTALQISEQRVAVEGQLNRFQQFKQQIPSRLGGLAIGALGGFIGGAVIGAGFQAMQVVLDAVGEKLQDLIDPARHARENIKELADEVDRLVEQGKLSRLEALKQILAEVGISVDDATARTLDEALKTQAANAAIEERIKLGDIVRQSDALRKVNTAALVDELIKEAQANGDVVTTLRSRTGPTRTLINGVNVLELAEAAYNDILEQLAGTQARDIELKNQQAAATFALTLAQNNLNAAASAYVARQTAPIDAKIERLQGQDPRSDRTRALERQLANAQGGGGTSNAAALKGLAEERQLILLRQRLRLLGANINLERYSGKFLLEAINAKINALQKEAAAQDRVNRLLDLQYRISKGLRRAEGESINEFLERRAQEGRAILSEQRDIEREARLERLNELQEQTQDEVALAELAEQKKTLLAQQGSDDRIKAIQKELEKSREADRKALESRIDTLEDQKKALQDAADNALKVSSAEHLAELRNYVEMSKTMSEIAAAAGEIRGLEQAREFLQAILSSGIVPAEQAAQLRQTLNAIDDTLADYQVKFDRFRYGGGAPHRPGAGFAKGGVFPLNNSMSPFGQNVRVGEEGGEIGVVLSNKVTQALRDSQGGGIGSMNFYGMPWEDRYLSAFKIKQTVREVIREELRG